MSHLTPDNTTNLVDTPNLLEKSYARHKDQIKAIVFDFDGTLAKPTLDLNLINKQVKAFVETQKLDQFIKSELIQAALPAMELIRLTKAKLAPTEANDFEKNVLDIIKDTEIEAAKQCSLFSFSRDLLSRLKQAKMPTAIITRNCRAAVEIVFPDWNNYIQVLLTREDVVNYKPHPEHLLSALSQININPALALMLGDHPQDILVGKRAGSKTGGVYSGECTKEELEALEPDFIAPNIDVLLTSLKF